MLAGSVDVMTQELVMLDAVFIAESVDHSNWQILRSLGRQLPEGDVRREFQRAVEVVEAQEDEHLGWARETKEMLVTLQAKSAMMAAAGAKMEEMVETVRGWFSSSGG